MDLEIDDEKSWQPSIQEFARPLSESVFIVLDLETSGSSPKVGAGITEIGAVKILGGQVIGEFQSLINPGALIPEYITELTGISDAMIQGSPTIESLLPSFFEFLGPASENILVAHNANFDLGFLKAAAAHHGFQWPQYKVFDTVRLARSVLSLDDVPDCKLSTLSQFFRTQTSPSHRALDDARATVEVLHGVFERFGSFGVTTVDDVEKFTSKVSRLRS
jgi:DNA polymerase III epsilon subunit family exonuclease